MAVAPDESRLQFSLQFGSINPGFVNGMQVSFSSHCFEAFSFTYNSMNVSPLSESFLCACSFYRYQLELVQLPLIWMSRSGTRYGGSLSIHLLIVIQQEFIIVYFLYSGGMVGF